MSSDTDTGTIATPRVNVIHKRLLNMSTTSSLQEQVKFVTGNGNLFHNQHR
jgi:hypothetical protein